MLNALILSDRHIQLGIGLLLLKAILRYLRLFH